MFFSLIYLFLKDYENISSYNRCVCSDFLIYIIALKIRIFKTRIILEMK